MAGLQEQALWDAEVYQIEQNDPVLGGPPNLAEVRGITNVPHQALANRTAWLKFEIGKLKTPEVSAIGSDAALDAVAETAVLTAAQGVLSPPLAIGGIIEHTEFSDGSARQTAWRTTPTGVFLTKHIRFRRGAGWSGWVADGPDIGDLVIQTHDATLLDRFEATGADLNRASYADLFDRTGTIYGAGDGASTFGTLDARGEFLRGWDNGRGINVGRAFGSSELDQLQGHNHWTVTANSGGSFAQYLNTTTNNVGEIGTILATDITGDGVNGAPRVGTETRPRNVALMFCIKF